MDEGIEKNQKVAHLTWKVTLSVTKRNQRMRNGRGFQSDKQYNLGLPTAWVILVIFLMYFLDRSLPKLNWTELFSEGNQQQLQQKFLAF